MARIRKLKVERIIQDLLEARRASTFETASFSAPRHHNEPLPVKECEVTQFIKGRTQLYRESWVTGPLDRAIKDLEHELER